VCRNAHSGITLTSEDITCYVGRDKHENEFLIQYGWPGDIWFHVEGISSAHVYFRLDCFASSQVNPQLQNILGKIPIDDLPVESIEDMCQIVKHNSIQGCKMASCKIVYTPHSNLKKTFQMEAGSVTYFDQKLQRHRRCDKDRKQVKELESTKSADITIDYYEEMKANERKMINLKKKLKKNGGMDIYDPVLSDLRGTKAKANRQGDALSGLESGLAALEGLVFVSSPSSAIAGAPDHKPNNTNENNNENDGAPEDLSHLPVWQREANDRLENSSKESVRFYLARGYTLKEIQEATTKEKDIDGSMPISVTLSRLWARLATTRPSDVNDDVDLSALMYEARNEEKDVLEAIYGEDDHVQFGWRDDNESDGNQSDDADVDLSKPFSFDSIIPVPGYAPPLRYEYPPPLLLEIYVDHGVSKYPFGTTDVHVEPPVLAVVGGGLPVKHLRKLTEKLKKRALERSSSSEAGEPQVFDLLQIVSELAEEVLEEESAAIEEDRKRQRAKQAQEERIVAKEFAESSGVVSTSDTKMTFRTEADRRAYAMSVVAKGFV